MFATMERGSTRNTPKGFSGSFNACIARMNSRDEALGWPSCRLWRTSHGKGKALGRKGVVGKGATVYISLPTREVAATL